MVLLMASTVFNWNSTQRVQMLVADVGGNDIAFMTTSQGCTRHYGTLDRVFG